MKANRIIRKALNGYLKYLITLGGATIAFMAGFWTCYAFALLPVVARFQ